MIVCGQNRLKKLRKLEENHLDSVDAVGASDPLWGGLQSVCCKKTSYQSAHLQHLPSPPRPAASHLPWPSCVWPWLRAGASPHQVGCWGESPGAATYQGAGVLISDFPLVPLSLGSNSFLLMSMMRQVKVFEDGSGVTQEMGEGELPHISWWGVSIVGEWGGLGRWRLQ